jgi:ribosomal protein S6E (S10)
MTHYATCFNCVNDRYTCPRHLALRDALKGRGVYTVKFKCPERRAYFAPGQRVAFDWKSFESDEYDTSVLHLTFTGTVIREKGTKFIVQVDGGKDISGEEMDASDVFTKNDQLLIKVRPADMRPLNEPTRAVCQACYHVEGNAESRCYQNGTDWVPTGCVLPYGSKKSPRDEEVMF